MTPSPLIRRYARALFECAREQSSLDAVERDAQALKQCLVRNEIYHLLLDPRLARNRLVLWDMILGHQADPLFKRFIFFLCKKGRVALVREILAEFIVLCNEARGILPVEVESALPLTNSQLDAIAKKLSERLGKRIRPHPRINRDLVGGFRIRVRDTVYDASVKQQLKRFHRNVLMM